jgi:hypothetical protein
MTTSEPFNHQKLLPGDYVVDYHGQRWQVHGVSRYASGGNGVRRPPGISVRPEGGGRARVMANTNFRTMERTAA